MKNKRFIYFVYTWSKKLLLECGCNASTADNCGLVDSLNNSELFNILCTISSWLETLLTLSNFSVEGEDISWNGTCDVKPEDALPVRCEGLVIDIGMSCSKGVVLGVSSVR